MSLPSAPDPNAPSSETHNASCHCGAFAYSVKLSPPFSDPTAHVNECNCSICQRNGHMLIYVPDGNVAFTKGSIEGFKAYSFGAKPKMAHLFCGTCASSCMMRSIDPAFFKGMLVVNVRMFEDVDVTKLNIKSLDGKNFTPSE